ncbi:MAG: glycosyltransferase [Bacteroidetes bacterium]|nr:glycosyltransferase [Bacteroidota bacterium]
MINFEENHIHIVSFDVPFPADYGGVMDVFHKIRTLHDCNIKIILHCFQYGRAEQLELNKYCEKVYYYQRKRILNPLKGKLPYIVSSRENSDLLKNLLKDNYPIIFEGIHTTFYLSHPDLRDRIKIVRNHNIEHEYYKNLAQVEKNIFKRIFFKTEAHRLKDYESSLLNATYVLAISQPDSIYLKSKGVNARWVSAFHPNDFVDIKSGNGNYIFYHGNLGVPENNHAALYLVKEVFKLINLPVVIAGSNPSKELKKAVRKLPYVTLKDNLSNDEIMEHIKDAQINILVTFQATGIKLKLLNSLFCGRHVVANKQMVENTGIESLCNIANNPFELAEKSFNLWEKQFTENERKERKHILENKFSNAASAEKILDLLRRDEKVRV